MPQIDLAESKYDEWDVEMHLFFGMRTKSKRQGNGIVRRIAYGNVMENTYSKGKIHGLCRVVTRSEVKIYVKKFGSYIDGCVLDDQL